MDTLTEKMRRRDFLGNGAKAAMGIAVLAATDNIAQPAAALSGILFFEFYLPTYPS